MVDISGIDYNFWPSILWTLGIIATGVVLFAIAVLLDFEGFGEFLVIAGTIAAIIGVIFGPTLIIGLQASETVAGEERRKASEQLSEQGFSRLDLDWGEKTFTASVDGEFFEGVLHPAGENKFQVLEVEEVTP